ncbi:DMP19 family protein [Mesorhizobium mediterraneum]|uniref:DMP19 family protein n=1 Tax=Mesorhizobium mediterraneum TaxID=43617 RepID=UPI00178263C3|nr:DUF4375 domain-containing protein [Mesorhizobium mediterraneum]
MSDDALPIELLNSDIPPSARVVELWGDPVLEVLDEPSEYHAVISAMPVAIKNVICVELLHWQVLNGGFRQYFYNSYGITAEGAVQGLSAMGLEKHAELTRQACVLLGKDFPEDRATRMELVGEIGSACIDFDALDDAFYALEEHNQNSLVAALDAYATAALKGQWQ